MPSLIGSDIKLMRDRYDEALRLRGVPATYQYPNLASTNAQGEAVVDEYSAPEPVHIFFDGNPKVRTFKRLGWVVENNQDLPFLIYCSFNIDHMQKDCLFNIAGLYSEIPDRCFRVVDITYDLQAPDHLVCQVIPVYDRQTVGYTEREVQKKFNTSNHFIKQDVDYRGHQYTTDEDDDRNFPSHYREHMNRYPE